MKFWTMAQNVYQLRYNVVCNPKHSNWSIKVLRVSSREAQSTDKFGARLFTIINIIFQFQHLLADDLIVNELCNFRIQSCNFKAKFKFLCKSIQVYRNNIFWGSKLHLITFVFNRPMLTDPGLFWILFQKLKKMSLLFSISEMYGKNI